MIRAVEVALAALPASAFMLVSVLVDPTLHVMRSTPRTFATIAAGTRANDHIFCRRKCEGSVQLHRLDLDPTIFRHLVKCLYAWQAESGPRYLAHNSSILVEDRTEKSVHVG